MAASSEGTDDRIERHISPDGRMRVEVIRAFDPRDIHEIAEQRRMHVRDAATGATLLDLRNVYLDSRFEWTADGGVEIGISDGAWVKLAADGFSWSTSADGGVPHPIGEAARLLPRLLDPPRRPTGRDYWERFKSGVFFLVIAAILAKIGWDAWHGQLPPRRLGAEARTQPINAWALTCPPPWTILVMRRDASGRLVVPPTLASTPLPPLAGAVGRYGDGRVLVEIEEEGATIRPEGGSGPVLRCTGGGGPP